MTCEIYKFHATLILYCNHVAKVNSRIHFRVATVDRMARRRLDVDEVKTEMVFTPTWEIR